MIIAILHRWLAGVFMKLPSFVRGLAAPCLKRRGIRVGWFRLPQHRRVPAGCSAQVRTGVLRSAPATSPGEYLISQQLYKLEMSRLSGKTLGLVN